MTFNIFEELKKKFAYFFLLQVMKTILSHISADRKASSYNFYKKLRIFA